MSFRAAAAGTAAVRLDWSEIEDDDEDENEDDWEGGAVGTGSTKTADKVAD